VSTPARGDSAKRLRALNCFPQNEQEKGPGALEPRAFVVSIINSVQFGVLFSRQIQEHSTSPHLNPLIHHQPGILVSDPAAPLHELDNLVRRLEVQPSGQSSLQVHFQKLTMPAIAALEAHVHAMTIIFAGHAKSIGEQQAKVQQEGGGRSVEILCKSLCFFNSATTLSSTKGT
jgi:hypothetical protein